MKDGLRALFIAWAIGSAGPAAADIVTNGGFEQEQFGDGSVRQISPADGSVRQISPGDTALYDWTVTDHAVDSVFWYANGYVPPNPLEPIGVAPHTGNLGINLADGSVRTISLEQPIALLPRQEYQVSYWVGNYSVNRGPVAVSVTITDGTSNTIILSETATAPATDLDSAWQQFTFPFTVRDGTSNTISFSESDGAYYAGLDDVSIVAVPEASTWTLMLVGFAGLGMLGIRRERLALA